MSDHAHAEDRAPDSAPAAAARDGSGRGREAAGASPLALVKAGLPGRAGPSRRSVLALQRQAGNAAIAPILARPRPAAGAPAAPAGPVAAPSAAMGPVATEAAAPAPEASEDPVTTAADLARGLVASHAAPPAEPPATGATLQREGPDPAPAAAPGAGPDDGIDAEATAKEAANLIKARKAKWAFDFKPSGKYEWALFEVKKTQIAFEGTLDLIPTGVKDTVYKGPVQVGGKTEKPAKAGEKAKTSMAPVLAAELGFKGDQLVSGLSKDLEFKIGGEALTPKAGKEALKDSKGEVTIAYPLGQLKFEAKFTAIKVDQDKKTRELTIAPPTITLGLSGLKMLQHRWEKAHEWRGQSFDYVGKFKVGGFVEIGPKWAAIMDLVKEQFGPRVAKDFYLKNFDRIAVEEAKKSVEAMAREMAETACKELPDGPVRSEAIEAATKRALEAAGEKDIAKSVAEIVAKDAPSATDEMVDAVQMVSRMRTAAGNTARAKMRELVLADLKAWVGGWIKEKAESAGDLAKVVADLVKGKGKAEQEALQKAAEQASHAIDEVAKEVAEEATKEIADKASKEEAQKLIQAEVKQELAAGATRTEAVLAAQKAGASLAEKEAVPMMRKAAGEVVRAWVKGRGAEFGARIGRMVAGFTVKRAAAKIGTYLVAGPLDFVLVGVDILAGFVDTAIKSQEIKVAGLTAVRMQDNYVSAYVAALQGETKGLGQSGGGDNLEGQAYLLGLKEGRQQWDKLIDDGVTTYGADKDELIARLKAEPMQIGRGAIVGKANPIIKELLFNRWVKVNKGWFESEGEVRASKDFGLFKDVVESNLEKEGRSTVARLANGVTLKLLALDSTSDRAWEFRTMDGRYVVTMGGDTTTHSGWITKDGVPLEELYGDQASGDKATGGDADRKARMATELAASTIRLSIGGMFLRERPIISAAGISKPGGVDQVFQDYLRSPEALGQTLAASGATIVLEGAVPGASTTGFFNATARNGKIVSCKVLPPVDLRKTPRGQQQADAQGIELGPTASDQLAASVIGEQFLPLTLAALPKLG